MFDPSKLNLDIDNKQENKEEKTIKKDDNIISENVKTEEIRDENLNINEKIKEEKIENTEEMDVLGNINLDSTIKKEENITPSINTTPDVKTNGEGNIEKDTDKNENISSKPTKKDNIENSEEKEEEKTPQNIAGNAINKQKTGIIFDININSLKDILTILIENSYDFLTIEPSEEAIKISFIKDKIIKDKRFIKYPIYSQILIKTKTVTKISVEETNKTQEGIGEIPLNAKNYKIISKTVPGNYGEKVFIKVEEIQKKIKKQAKKTSLNQIFGFLGTIAFISLIIGGGFTGFIVLNAQTVEDVKFFHSLGISLNDINTFITKIITFIFSILVFVETTFLIVFLFKFSLTKKEFKQKKIKYGIFATIFLLITFVTASAWMVIDQKINSLPNWQEMSYGDVQTYDNSKLRSEKFDKGGSLIKDTSNLIGPVELKFDLTYFAEKETKAGMKIKKYIWNFGGEDIVETQNPTIIREFNEKGNYEISLIVEEVDLKGDVIEKKVEDIPQVNISYVVDIEEKSLNNGGKQLKLDASSLKELGKIEWYSLDNLQKPYADGYILNYGKPIFEETLIGMYIRRNDKENETLDKVFVISGEEKTSLNGKISFVRGIENDLEYFLQVDETSVDAGNGFIEEYKWIIGKKEVTKTGDIENPTESSKIKFEFEEYGKHEVKVILTDSSGETKELKTTIDIPKILKLKNTLKIYNENKEIEDVKYENKLNEYYINEIGAPTRIKLDSRFIRADNNVYSLKSVSWDFDSNGDIDETEKLAYYDINSEGNHKITVEYTFVHRKIETDIIKVKEQIFIEAVKKEAIIDFEIIKNSEYAPVIIKLDGSKSKVKDENIEKFIWDFGDGVIETRDSVVPGHKYSVPGDYNIKLTVVSENGKEYSKTKKLILKPKPQSVNINLSMKSTLVNQGIDFYSNKSQGQIVAYLWDFGDGNKSTEANPTHAYSTPGVYTVTLKVDFDNNNVLEDKVKVEIRED